MGVAGDLLALVAPHAGLMYSGPVAAHAYRLLPDRRFDVVVLVGPSHFVGFDGSAVYPAGGFETPLGVAEIDEACAAALVDARSVVHEHTRPLTRASIRSRCSCRFCSASRRTRRLSRC